MTSADQARPSVHGSWRQSELSMRLRPVPFTASRARHAVRSFCLEHGLHSLAGDAELLTSELVTNPIAHARYVVTLHVIVQDGQLVVTVTNDAGGGGSPAPAAESTGRRGLAVVAALAAQWDLDLGVAQTTAWFRLAPLS